MSSSALNIHSMDGGFADAVFDSQIVFDTVMNAMAKPGTIFQLPELAVGPDPLLPISAALLQTLCDVDTTVWLDSAAAKKPVVDWLQFHTGAPTAEYHGDAHFALIADVAAMPDLAGFAQGSQEYPDRSASLIIQVAQIAPEPEWNLSGPGIKDITPMRVAGLPSVFLDQWAQNGQRFPRGVDVIFVSPDAFVCLPRTTKVRVGVA